MIGGGEQMVTAGGKVDIEAAEQAARALLVAIGADVDREGLRYTPRRMAASYAEMLQPPTFEFTTFENVEKYDELVVAKKIPLYSLCEHHLLPFTGIADVAYLPADRIAGLSKLARVVEWFARGLQVPGTFDHSDCRPSEEELSPKGVGVVYRGRTSVHGHARRRGSRHTCCYFGVAWTYCSDARTRAEFLALTGVA